MVTVSRSEQGRCSSKIRSRRRSRTRRGTTASREAAVDLGFCLPESSELFWDLVRLKDHSAVSMGTSVICKNT